MPHIWAPFRFILLALLMALSAGAWAQDVPSGWKPTYKKLQGLYKQAEDYRREKQYAKAEEIYEEILATDSDSSSRLFHSNNKDLFFFYKDELKSPGETIRVGRIILKKYPRQHAAIVAGYHVGEELEKLGRKDEAIKVYRDVVDLHLKHFGKKITQNSYPTGAIHNIAAILGFTEEAAALHQKLADEQRDNIVAYAKDEAKANLIRNYSDCALAPLQLYFGAMKYQVRDEEVRSIIAQIIQEHSRCKLYPYARFRSGELFHVQYLKGKKKADLQQALKEYRWVIDSPRATIFPESREPWPHPIIGYRMNGSMKAISMYRIGQLLEIDDPRKAGEMFEQIAAKLGGQIDFRGWDLAISARLALLEMWLDKHKNQSPSPQLEKICNELLAGFPNQEWKNVSLHHRALKHLAAFYDRVGRSKESERTRTRIIRDFPSGNSNLDIDVVRSLIESKVHDPRGIRRALRECPNLIEASLGSMKIASQFACAELKLKSGGRLMDAADDFRAIVAAHPQNRHHFSVCGHGPANLVVQAGGRADSIERFVSYVGDPPKIEWLSSLKKDYLRDPTFAEFMALRPEWVFKHIDPLLASDQSAIESVLQNVGPDSARPLALRFGAANDAVRRKIFSILVRLAKDHPDITAAEILSAYKAASETERARFAPLLQKIAHPSFQTALRESGGLPDKGARIAAIKGLAAMKAPGFENRLLKFFNDPDWQVREVAIESLGGLEQERFLTSLIDMFKDNSGYVTMEAVEQVAKLGETAVPYLVAAYPRSEVKSERHFIIRALGRIKTESSFDFLASKLDEPHHQRRAGIVSAMYNVNPAKAIPYMRKILRSSDKANSVAKFHIKTIFKRDGILSE